jgi:hypothetical protein
MRNNASTVIPLRDEVSTVVLSVLSTDRTEPFSAPVLTSA